MKHYVHRVITLAFGALLIQSASAGQTLRQPMRQSGQEIAYNDQQKAFKKKMHQLWLEHIVWDHAYTVAATANRLSEAQAIADRLMRNQEDIGRAFALYYGARVGKQITALLKEHIMIGGNLIEALKSNNKPSIMRLKEIWFQNGEQITQFLHHISPQLDQRELSAMFRTHLRLATQDAITRLRKRWHENIRISDQSLKLMLAFADYLAKGILMQKGQEQEPAQKSA